MKYVTKSTNTEFHAIMARRSGKPSGFYLCKILKNGKPGKPMFCRAYSSEKTAQELINTLERYNPGSHWIEA